MQSINEAFTYLNTNLGMASPPRFYTEDDEAYYFSGGITAEPVNDFKSGMCVRKRGGSITAWDLQKGNAH